MSESTTHFGFKEVPVSEKQRLVEEVFSSVATRYDLMNDLMSMGMHRLWKRFAVAHAALREGQSVLDVAGGTGDLSARLARAVGPSGSVICADINGAMLAVGRDRLLDRGIAQNVRFVQANAETLPFADGSFDAATIAFGLRNVTDKQRALVAMRQVLRPGGRLVVLEFSQVILPRLRRLYDTYSFNVLPALGKVVAGDRESYQYLVESIRRHPAQAELAGMMEAAGLERVDWCNLSAGIVAVHRGVSPVIAVDAATIETQVLPKIARAIARVLEFDTETRDALGRMSGRVIAVDLAGFERSVYLLPQSHGLGIRLRHDGEVHVRIRGSLLGFVKLARSRARNEPVPAGTVEILGDLSTAQQVQSLIGRIDVDWEEMASRLIGDTAARKLGVLLHGMRRWAGAGAEAMAMNFSEYVRYEIETVPERTAVEGFMQGVDALRADADRLAERVRLLRRRLDEGR